MLPRRAMPAALLPLLALVLALLPAPGAHAGELTVSGGRLDWAVKSSFQAYVTGPVAQGGYALSGGAATAGSDTFRFHSARGAYHPDTGGFEIHYSGGVRFTGHTAEDGTHELDLTISNPSVRVSGGSGTLYVDVRGRSRETGRYSEHGQVAFASLDLGGVDLRGGTRLALAGVPATLTADGARAFAGYYQAGDALAPVGFTADTLPERGDPAPGPEPTAEPPADEEPPASGEPGTGGPLAIVDAHVDWGVRRTFREYVTGPVAQGTWELGDGAGDGGAVFRMPAGRGTLDPRAGTLDVEFSGAVTFTGDHLDLRLSAFAVRVADGTGTLAADVASAGSTTEAVELVTFEAGEALPEDGLLVLSEAPAELTAEGAAAFGGLYPAGTAMDPVSLAVAVAEDTALPALPDLGSELPGEPAAEPPADGTGGAESGPDADGGSEPAAGTDPPSPRPLIAAGAAVLLPLAAVALLALRRRRAGHAPPHADTTPEKETPRT